MPYDGNGRDEIFPGDTVMDHGGRPLRVIDLFNHRDEAVIGKPMIGLDQTYFLAN